MSQENGSEASENPNRFSGKRDRADAEDMVPFKKRVRFLSDDLMKEVTDDKTERSGANYNDVKVFTASSLTDAGKGNKTEIIPTQERSTCTTCNDADFSASSSQLAIRESGFGAGNEPRGDGGEKHEKESQELIEHTAAGGGGSCSQTGHGTTVPPTSGGQNVEADLLPEVQEAAMNDGSDGSSAPSGEEQSKGDLFYRRRRAKQSSSPEEVPLPDQSAPDQGEGDFSGDGLDAEGGTKGGDDGGGAFSPTDTAFESGDDRSSTEDERHEEVQIAATEVGEMSDDVGECKKDENFGGDAPDVVGGEEHIPKAEGADTKNEDGGDEWSPIRPPFECEAAVKDGSLASSGEESSKVKNKLVEDDESEMIHDGDAYGKDEKVTEGEDGGGDGSFSAINTIIESNNGGNGEGDREEQGKHAAMEDDNYALGDGKQAQEPEPVTNHGGSRSRSYADATAGSEAGDHHEQEQPAAMEDDDHNENIGNNEPADVEEQGNEDKETVEADEHEQGQVAVLMEDGGNENITDSEPAEIEEQGNNEGKEAVEADEHEQGQPVAMEDGGNENIRNSEPEGVEERSNKGKEPVEADHHEQAMEDGGDANAAVVFSGEELEDKKGKKPVEYAGSRKESNQIAEDVVGDKEQPAEGDHNDFIQVIHVFGDPGSDEIEDMAIQGDMQTQQDPMTVEYIRKRTRSIHHEQREVGGAGGDTPGEEARKKRKHGSDDVGGSTSAIVAYNEPPMQLANHTFTLFGVPIPREQEPDDDAAINTNLVLEISDSDHGAGGEFADGSPPTQQLADGVELYNGVNMAEEQVQPVARRGIQLFGVYITQEQEQSVEMQNGDQGNSHSGGESSMQRPRSGLRLFGFDII